MSVWPVAPTAEGTILWKAPLGDELEWQLGALCRQPGADPEKWFPEHPEKASKERIAARLCRDCPVRRECAEWALRVHELYGVWGGMTESQRRRHWTRSESDPTRRAC